MKTNIRLLVILFLVSFLLTTACQEEYVSSKEESFDKMYPDIEMNSKMSFWEPDTTINTFISGDPVHLILENLTDKSIQLSNDYGIVILTYDKKSRIWLNVENEGKYIPHDNLDVGPVLLQKNEDSPGVIGIPLSPKIENHQKPIEIRIVVFGNLVDEQKIPEEVGAFIDMTLYP